MIPGPLHGIRILEVGHMLAGPYATMLLADLGAEVTKIEPPGGDISRQVGDTYFASLNRGKRSVCLDLATEAGQAGLAALAVDAHALLVNLKPSAIQTDTAESWETRLRRLGVPASAVRTLPEALDTAPDAIVTAGRYRLGEHGD